MRGYLYLHIQLRENQRCFHDRISGEPVFVGEIPAFRIIERVRQFSGRVVFYVQEVTSPARVVPVYTSRWWRFSVGDRFDDHPVDEARVQTLLDGACQDRLEDLDLYGLLSATADQTLGAVDSSIPGMPITWQAFWRSTVDGESATEIANDLGMTAGAVRQAKLRVMVRLREILA